MVEAGSKKINIKISDINANDNKVNNNHINLSSLTAETGEKAESKVNEGKTINLPSCCRMLSEVNGSSRIYKISTVFGGFTNLRYNIYSNESPCNATQFQHSNSVSRSETLA